MTLENGSFEDGWETLPVTKNQEPTGWALAWGIPGSKLIAPKAGNGDTETTVLCVPECVHKLSIQLPPDEQLGGEDALILDGSTTYKIFGKSAFRATLAQQWTVTPGAVCSLTIPVQVHGGLKPDGVPYNVDRGAAYWRVTINGTPGPWFTFIDDFDDRVWMWYSPGFKALYGTVDLLIEFESHTLAPIDFFTDNITFSSNTPQPQPTNTIPPGGYSRTYWVVPDEFANLDRRLTIYGKAAIAQVTVGPSADDARAWATELIDAGNTVTAVNWDIPEADKDAWEDYYLSREPRIIVEFQGGDPNPPLPPVDPPTGNAPQPIVHYSGNFVGLQHAFTKDGWLEYIQQARPTVTKLFSCGDAITAKRAQPQMLSVWRKHVSDDGGWLIGDRITNAKRLAGLYDAELTTTCNNMGITRAEALKLIDVIESLNETVPSNNAAHINAAVEFDVAFSECVYQLFGGAVKAGIMNVAVGNPLESEVELLLPCAKESHAGRAILAYHSYWAANKTQSYLDEGWPWHAGRWQEWDIIFNQQNLYPTYYLGECGICHSPDGQWFIPTEGWKKCGDFPNYIKQIIDFNDLLTDWNEWNQGRCYGGTLFICGAWGWDSFDVSSGNLALLREAMKVYA